MTTELDILRAWVELLREAHTLANDALRSAWSVAEREGRETNWQGYRAVLRASLDASHAAMAALSSAPPSQVAADPSLRWQPFDTAPRDGRWIIARCNDHSELFLMLWGVDRKGQLGWCTRTRSFGDGLFLPNGDWIEAPQPGGVAP